MTALQGCSLIARRVRQRVAVAPGANRRKDADLVRREATESSTRFVATSLAGCTCDWIDCSRCPTSIEMHVCRSRLAMENPTVKHEHLLTDGIPAEFPLDPS